MELRFSLNNSNIKETAKKLKAMASENSLRILLNLHNKADYLKIHSSTTYKKPSSTYKALERLVKADILKKEYNPGNKKIVYSKTASLLLAF